MGEYTEYLRKSIENQYKSNSTGCGGSFGELLCWEIHINGLTFIWLAEKWGISLPTLGDLIRDHCIRLQELPKVDHNYGKERKMIRIDPKMKQVFKDDKILQKRVQKERQEVVRQRGVDLWIKLFGHRPNIDSHGTITSGDLKFSIGMAGACFYLERDFITGLSGLSIGGKLLYESIGTVRSMERVIEELERLIEKSNKPVS